MTPGYDYLVDPAAIERRSFALIRAETDLARFGPLGTAVVERLVHAAGDPAVAEHVSAVETSVARGIQALQQGVPVLCDVEMVRHGLSRRHLTGTVRCHLRDPETARRAAREAITRTMAAVDAWPPQLAGAVAVIGNAPTALFRLLEHLHAGAGRPALIVGMPCGFVGAAESKAALADFADRHDQPAVFVSGRLGGSALAAAAVNAMARLATGEGNAA